MGRVVLYSSEYGSYPETVHIQLQYKDGHTGWFGNATTD